MFVQNNFNIYKCKQQQQQQQQQQQNKETNKQTNKQTKKLSRLCRAIYPSL